MAKNNIEVEIKIPVSKSLFEKAKRSVKKIGKYISYSREIDKYVNAPHRNFLAKNPTEEFLRVRSKKGGDYFTYKHGYWNSKNEHTHSDEFETKVESLKELEKILKVLNFKNILLIDKQREIYKVNSSFEISLDRVKGLGYFIEIESLKGFGNHDKAMEKIYTFAKELGLNPTKRDSKGYVTLMMEKKKHLGR